MPRVLGGGAVSYGRGAPVFLRASGTGTPPPDLEIDLSHSTSELHIDAWRRRESIACSKKRFIEEILLSVDRPCSSGRICAQVNMLGARSKFVNFNPLERFYESLYRGTSLIRNCPPLGPYIRTMPMALCGTRGGGLFLISEVPL